MAPEPGLEPTRPKAGDFKSGRDYRTILTLLSRMAAKGWLEVEKDGQANYYTAAVPRKKAVQAEIRRFLDEVVGPEREHQELLRAELERRRPAARTPRARHSRA